MSQTELEPKMHIYNIIKTTNIVKKKRREKENTIWRSLTCAHIRTSCTNYLFSPTKSQTKMGILVHWNSIVGFEKIIELLIKVQLSIHRITFCDSRPPQLFFLFYENHRTNV